MKPEIPTLHRGAGRPTRAQAEARLEELIDVALDTFLERGFELATIEMIATRMNMTKRTVYAKFADKAELFEVAVSRAIERQIVPPAKLEKLDNGNLAETLCAIAEMRIAQIATENGVRLQRIIATESYRFPELGMLSYERSARPLAEFAASLLDRHIAAGHIIPTDTKTVAGLFMSMTITGQVREIVAGARIPRDEVRNRVRFAVGVLLDGLRPR